MTRRPAGCFLVLSLFLGSCLFADSFPGRFFRFERLSPRTETASMVGISSICQDDEGFLWLGTSAGLARYDGYRFVFFPPADGAGPPGTPVAVFPVAPARSGDLLVGTNTRGLLAFSRETRTFAMLPAGGPSAAGPGESIVLAVQEDAQGNVWIGTRSQGLHRLDPKTGASARVPLDPGADIVWDVLADRTGSIWAATLDFGLYRIDPATGATLNFRFRRDDPASIGGDTVWTLFEDSSGDIWAGTKNGGLNRYDPGSGGFVRFYGAGDFPRDLSSRTITAVAEDRAGRLWLGTARDGLRIWDKRTGRYGIFRHDHQDPESLGDDGVTSLFEDAGGVIWVGTARGGLNKCLAGKAKFEHYKHNPSDPRSVGRNSVRALWQDPSGTLWVGSKAGLETVDGRAGAKKALDLGVSAVLGDARGAIWLGTETDGLVRFEPSTGRLTRYLALRNGSGPLANRINALCRDASDPDVLWIGTQRGLNRFETRSGRWEAFVRKPGAADSLANPVVSALLDDGAGSVWVGTLGGLSRLDKATGRAESTISRLDDPPGASIHNNTVNCLHKDRRGSIWVGTDGGLDRLDRAAGRWKHYAQKDGLVGEVVGAILEDGAGALWLSTNRGLARFDPATERFTNFGLHDGLQSLLFNPRAAAHGPDGLMLFGGPNGINAFRPAEIKKDPNPPAVVWTAFARNNVEKEPPRSPSAPGDVILDYKTGLVTFEFAALSYDAPEMNSFACRLEPLDAEWTSLVPGHAVSFYDLAPGRYVLRVKAANPDGVWNESGLAIGLRVLGPFWRTWWFLLLATAVLASGSVMAIRARARLKAAPAALGTDLDGIVGTYGLTAREEEILRLVLRGAKNEDIGHDLFISGSTVRNHISNIYQKLGVGSRLELINRVGRDSRKVRAGRP